jgi:hypothetical protein
MQTAAMGQEQPFNMLSLERRLSAEAIIRCVRWFIGEAYRWLMKFVPKTGYVD